MDESNPGHRIHLCAMSLQAATDSQVYTVDVCLNTEGVVFSAKCICKAG